HPIEHLMGAAEQAFALTLGSQATSLADAAQKYRARRGRHPPPGFDAWYAYAVERDALVVESFFDQIHDDLEPFWGMDVYTLRRIVGTFSPGITIHDGVVDSAVKMSYERVQAMVDMLAKLVAEKGVEVPDLHIPVNVNEEVGMLAEWEAVDTAVQIARPILTATGEVVSDYAPIEDEEYEDAGFDPEWLDARLRHTTHAEYYGPRPFWSLLRPACSPASPARKEPLVEHSAAALLPLEAPAGDSTFRGYVMNWSVTEDACAWPPLQGLHGGFVAPEEMSVTKKLFPLFSTSKMGVSNEVLVPGLVRWNESRSSEVTWEEKQDKLFWRGPATGGKNSAINWQRFHRHRFVAMLNATHVEIAEGLLHAGNESMIGLGYARNFRLLPGNDYGLATQRGGIMAEWVNSWADAKCTDLHCNVATEGGGCVYTDEYFSVAPASNSTVEGRGCKYAAVIDGNGGDDGGEFIDALRFGRTTLKASIYKKWYDNRLVPWVHFVPIDNTFVDLYGIMEYFLGTMRDESAEDGHDEAARKIAEGGQAWAAKVLRKEDMFVYMYRLLLEYARVVDTRRQRLGW
ncbi:hypothetical protein K458DRAFT_248977, partial [Lentithecium fluviatile CBS 122367]